MLQAKYVHLFNLFGPYTRNCRSNGDCGLSAQYWVDSGQRPSALWARRSTLSCEIERNRTKRTESPPVLSGSLRGNQRELPKVYDFAIRIPSVATQPQATPIINSSIQNNPCFWNREASTQQLSSVNHHMLVRSTK